MTTPNEFLATIPPTWRDRAAEADCSEAGFGAGPGGVAGKVQRFPTPVRLEEAVAWVRHRSHFYKAAHIRLTTGAVLWFGPNGFTRAEERGGSPTPGLTVRT